MSSQRETIDQIIDSLKQTLADLDRMLSEIRMAMPSASEMPHGEATEALETIDWEELAEQRWQEQRTLDGRLAAYDRYSKTVRK